MEGNAVLTAIHKGISFRGSTINAIDLLDGTDPSSLYDDRQDEFTFRNVLSNTALQSIPIDQ